MRGIARRIWATKGIGAAGIAGVAVVAAAVLLLGPLHVGGTGVTGVSAADPTATATPNTSCNLKVSKAADVSAVAEGGQITYTITVENGGSGDGSCDGVAVTDTIPDDTDCNDASVDSSSDIKASHVTIKGCKSSGDVTWKTTSSLATGDQLVLTMVLDLTSGAKDGDTISNEACAVSDNSDPVGDCDTEKTDVSSATPVPTTAPTATTAPIAPAPTARPIAPPPPIPTAVVMPILSPNTGSGPDSSSNSALLLALALTGGALLLLGGTGVWLRRRS